MVQVYCPFAAEKILQFNGKCITPCLTWIQWLLNVCFFLLINIIDRYDKSTKLTVWVWTQNFTLNFRYRSPKWDFCTRNALTFFFTYIFYLKYLCVSTWRQNHLHSKKRKVKVSWLPSPYTFFINFLNCKVSCGIQPFQEYLITKEVTLKDHILYRKQSMANICLYSVQWKSFLIVYRVD